MGKSTISMAIFNSKLLNYQRVYDSNVYHPNLGVVNHPKKWLCYWYTVRYTPKILGWFLSWPPSHGWWMGSCMALEFYNIRRVFFPTKIVNTSIFHGISHDSWSLLVNPRVNPSFVFNMSWSTESFAISVYLVAPTNRKGSYSSITPVTEEVGAVSSYRGLANRDEAPSRLQCG